MDELFCRHGITDPTAWQLRATAMVDQLCYPVFLYSLGCIGARRARPTLSNHLLWQVRYQPQPVRLFLCLSGRTTRIYDQPID